MGEKQFPAQKQTRQPGLESEMNPKPQSQNVAYKGSDKLKNKVALITGGDSGIGRAVAIAFAKEGIRVNAVAPGPIWTPLIPSTFSEKKVEQFGSDTPMGRAGQPFEIAPCYVFLASQDASYMTGQILHPNGGDIVNS